MHDTKSPNDPIDKLEAGSSNGALDLKRNAIPHTFNEQTNYVPTKVIITASLQ
jgi:hypothetical protein